MEGIRHYGKAKGGQMRFTENNRIKFERALQALEGKDFELSIKECSEPTTEDQHAYYRSFVRNTLVGCEIFGGWNEKRIHEFFQSQFLGYTRMEIVTGKEYVVRKAESTANIGKRRMAEFIEKVIAWCAVEGITIGSPDDYFAGKYKTQTRNG